MRPGRRRCPCAAPNRAPAPAIPNTSDAAPTGKAPRSPTCSFAVGERPKDSNAKSGSRRVRLKPRKASGKCPRMGETTTNPRPRGGTNQQRKRPPEELIGSAAMPSLLIVTSWSCPKIRSQLLDSYQWRFNSGKAEDGPYRVPGSLGLLMIHTR